VISDGAVEQCTLLAPRAGVTLALGEACRAPSECGAGVNCVGQFAGLGKCAVTRTRPAGDGAECADDAGCGAGLVCAGATRGYGMCNSAWMRGSFSSAASRALPARATVAERIVVRGLATVDTDVLLSATIRHPRPGDLTVTLSNPASAELPVLGAVTATGWSFSGVVGGFSGDESVNGEWTLRITDRAGAVTDGGTLDGATLTITSRWD